jgi:pimeloyl-ACP methyl ester carboxylesterase/class 3 adenylate cyclase
VVPQTRFAEVDGLSIAYQVSGGRSLDLVLVHGLHSHIEGFYDHPGYGEWIERLASFARVITFDKRGSGMSDRLATPPTLEERMADVGAVMDAAGSDGAWLVGVSEGGPMSLLFAATYPQRTRGLVLLGSFARYCCAPDYPHGPEREKLLELIRSGAHSWGDPAGPIPDLVGPSMAQEPVFRQAVARACRLSFPPKTYVQMWELVVDIDVRDLLPSVAVPSLVISRENDVVVPSGHGRYLAEHLPNAEFHLLPGGDHLAHLLGDEGMSLVEEFVTGNKSSGIHVDRMLATVLMTDIEGSTEEAVRLGDKRWRERLDRHDEISADQVTLFGGTVVDRTGDGILATFSGPAKAIACARAIRVELGAMGIRVRAGLHLGEVERRGTRIGGIAVHLAARIMATADGGEIHVSRTMKDVVAGSGIDFAPCGSFELKGIEGTWELYSV